jgi:hypothetical protein
MRSSMSMPGLPDRIGFVGVDMQHPAGERGQEAPTCSLAGIGRDDRSTKPELCSWLHEADVLATRRNAEVDVDVPARNGERSAPVEFVFGSAIRGGIHCAHQFVTRPWARNLDIEQRSGSIGIEAFWRRRDSRHVSRN